MEQNQLKHKAKTLAEVFQRSSANVEGRNGYLSRRHHQLRGLDHPRKRACLTAVHNFSSRVLTARPRRSAFSGRSPARWLPPFWEPLRYRQRLSVLRDEHWNRLKGCRVADAVIKANLALLPSSSRSRPSMWTYYDEASEIPDARRAATILQRHHLPSVRW